MTTPTSLKTIKSIARKWNDRLADNEFKKADPSQIDRGVRAMNHWNAMVLQREGFIAARRGRKRGEGMTMAEKMACMRSKGLVKTQEKKA